MPLCLQLTAENTASTELGNTALWYLNDNPKWINTKRGAEQSFFLLTLKQKIGKYKGKSHIRRLKKKGIEKKKQGPLYILSGEKKKVIKLIYFSGT